jgi:hypothetical protein
VRLILFGLLSALIAALAWQATRPSDEDGIRLAITAQLEAFHQDDPDAEFAIAAPGIQAKHQNAEAFSNMVALAYPQAYRPRKVTFLDLVETSDRLLQKVLLTGQEGGEVLALYEMVKIDGVWRINGCMLAMPHRGQAI